MLQENTANLLNGKRVPLTGVAAPDDELGSHPVEVGALVLHDAVVPGVDLHVGEHGDDGMPRNARSQGKFGQVLQVRVFHRRLGEIVVNDPLVYGGVRFYQASYGPSGKVEKLVLDATPTTAGEKREISLALDETAVLDADTAVRFAQFIPDYAVRDGQVYRRSNQLGSPAARLVVTTKAGKSFDVWLPTLDGVGDNDKAPYKFEATDLKLGHFTGLQVSQEPGQWGVWAGVVLMGIGLAFVFYIVHVRFWAVPVRDEKTGNYSLCIGGAANRNRDAFEQRFNELVAAIEKELKSIGKPAPSEHAETVAGK